MKKRIIILSLILLLLFFENITYEQSNEKVNITIPTYNVKIDDSLVDNQYSKHAMTLYKGITYLPLTDGYCNALGLTTSSDSENRYINNNNNYNVPK